MKRGAEKPEDYGYYFWWGDTVGYKRENNAWVATDGSNTNFMFSSNNTPTYNKDKSALLAAGYIDSTGNLVAAHDAAHEHWGGSWRLPTYAESYALVNNCTTTLTTRNGVYGRLVTGKGAYANRSIFLPAAGRGSDSDSRFVGAGSWGAYWTSLSYAFDTEAWSLLFDSGDIYQYGISRSCGQPVRPVRGFAE